MTANGISEEVVCNVRRDFGVGKGAALVIRKLWRGQGRWLGSGL